VDLRAAKPCRAPPGESSACQRLPPLGPGGAGRQKRPSLDLSGQGTARGAPRWRARRRRSSPSDEEARVLFSSARSGHPHRHARREDRPLYQGMALPCRLWRHGGWVRPWEGGRQKCRALSPLPTQHQPFPASLGSRLVFLWAQLLVENAVRPLRFPWGGTQ
jgi:hypothetical protein